LAAEAGEHLLLAQGHLAAAAGTAKIGLAANGAGYALDAINSAFTAAFGSEGPPAGTAAGLHADADAAMHAAAQQAAAAAHRADAAGAALLGTSRPPH
jgi:hypothetical protein